MNNEVKNEVISVLVEMLDLDEFDEELAFEKDSMDSFAKINLLVFLEDIVNIELSITELFECKKLGDILAICLKETEI